MEWGGIFVVGGLDVPMCVAVYIPTIPLIYESRSYGFSVCLGKKHFFFVSLIVSEYGNVMSELFFF